METEEEIYNRILGENTREKEIIPQISIKNKDLVRELEEKKQELLIAKLQKEIDSLSKTETPTTNIDYYQKMLDMQNTFNNKLLEMQQQNFNTQLALERLKIEGGSDELTWLEPLIPILTKILPTQSPPQQPILSQDNNLKGGDTMKEKEKVAPKESEVIPADKIEDRQEYLNEYIKLIKEGKITEEEAFEDFKEEMPLMAKITPRETFHQYYEDIKSGKLQPKI